VNAPLNRRARDIPASGARGVDHRGARHPQRSLAVGAHRHVARRTGRAGADLRRPPGGGSIRTAWRLHRRRHSVAGLCLDAAAGVGRAAARGDRADRDHSETALVRCARHHRRRGVHAPSLQPQTSRGRNRLGRVEPRLQPALPRSSTVAGTAQIGALRRALLAYSHHGVTLGVRRSVAHPAALDGEGGGGSLARHRQDGRRGRPPGRRAFCSAAAPHTGQRCLSGSGAHKCRCAQRVRFAARERQRAQACPASRHD